MKLQALDTKEFLTSVNLLEFSEWRGQPDVVTKKRWKMFGIKH